MTEYRYYVTRKYHEHLLELRQVRHKDNPSHPHDVCAVASNVGEMRSMAHYLTGAIDWSEVEECPYCDECPPLAPVCGVIHDNYMCIRKAGHEGKHVACAPGAHAIREWEDE